MNTNIILDNAYNSVPDQTGLIFENSHITYREIWDNVNRLTNVLIQIGCSKGTRIGILSHNRPEDIYLYYSAARVGAIFIPLDYSESTDNLINMINSLRIVYLFVDNRCLNLCISIHHSLTTVNNYISLQNQHASYLNYKLLMSHASDKYYCTNTKDSDPTAILFTSGTTGKRKAVAFSHLNFIRHALCVGNITCGPSFVSLNCTPFFHILGLQCIFSSFYSHHPLVIATHYNIPEILAIFKKENVYQTMLTPNLLFEIIHYPEFVKTDFSTLNNIKISGDLSHASLIMDSINAFPKHVKFNNLYGTTETTYDITIMDNEDFNLNCSEEERSKKIVRFSSIGRPIEQVKVIIADDEENELPVGEVGEILVHTDRYMIGYVNMETGEIEEKDDYWFHTADLAYCDEDGYIFPIGQKIDSLLNRGKTYPENYSSNFLVYPCVSQNKLENFKSLINQDTYLSFLIFLQKIYESKTPDEIIEKYTNEISKFIPGSIFGVHLAPSDSDAGSLFKNDEMLKWDMPYFDTIPFGAVSTNIDTEINNIIKSDLSKYISLQDYIEQLHPDHLICVPMFSQNRKLMGILSFGRIGNNWEFSRYEQTLIIQIANHICVALSKAFEHQGLVERNKLLENIIMLSYAPIFVTNVHGEIIYENQYAHTLFERERLGGNESNILEAGRKNVEFIISNYLGHTSCNADAHIVNDTINYHVRTTYADPEKGYFVTTAIKEGKEIDYSSLKQVLTNHEINIVTCIADGMSNQAISENMHITINTVKYHLKNIYRKMEVTNKTELLTKVYSMSHEQIININF